MGHLVQLQLDRDPDRHPHLQRRHQLNNVMNKKHQRLQRHPQIASFLCLDKGHYFPGFGLCKYQSNHLHSHRPEQLLIHALNVGFQGLPFHQFDLPL